jgi:hypothetical protein
MRREKRFALWSEILFVVVCCCAISACKQVPITQAPIPTSTQLPSNSPTPSFTITSTLVQPSATSAPPPEPIEFILSIEAGDYVGETATIKIEKAYCSYRPDVKGAPTFCNDQPFPDHTFTLLAWGKDWTDLDGECLYIEGEVEEYKGKYEIIADSRDQVSICE